MRAPRRRTVAAFAVILCAIAAVYLARVRILTGIGTFLIVQDPIEPADIIFVLNGDIATRPFHVARLVKQGIAGKVVIVRGEESPTVVAGVQPNLTDMCIAMLKRAGVPESGIVQLPAANGVNVTFAEAAALRSYLRTNPLQRIVVVTSAFHSRRARWIITRTLAGLHVKIMMSPAPDPRYTPRNWWRQENGLFACQDEYIRLVYDEIEYR